jgi:hypothetical protein
MIATGTYQGLRSRPRGLPSGRERGLKRREGIEGQTINNGELTHWLVRDQRARMTRMLARRLSA